MDGWGSTLMGGGGGGTFAAGDAPTARTCRCTPSTEAVATRTTTASPSPPEERRATALRSATEDTDGGASSWPDPEEPPPPPPPLQEYPTRASSTHPSPPSPLSGPSSPVAVPPSPAGRCQRFTVPSEKAVARIDLPPPGPSAAATQEMARSPADGSAPGLVPVPVRRVVRTVGILPPPTPPPPSKVARLRTEWDG